MSMLIPHDELVARDVVLLFANANILPVSFQYPPRVKSDARIGEWTSTASQGGNSNSPVQEEPVFTYEGGGPRKIQLEWDYVIDEENWPITRIQDNLLRLRSYAANIDAKNQPAGGGGNKFYNQLVIKFRCYAIGGKDLMSYRADGVTITHDDTLITVNGRTFPQKSTVSMNLASWPKVLNVSVASGQLKTFQDWY